MEIQYAPEDVVTLAGTEYIDYFNENKERWIKARDAVTKKGGIPLKSLLREVMVKMETGEITYGELRGIKEYRKLLFEPKYARQLERKAECIDGVAWQDHNVLLDKIIKNEITSLDKIIENKDWNLAYKYYGCETIDKLEEQASKVLIAKIQREGITTFEEIEANRKWTNSQYETSITFAIQEQAPIF